MQPEKEESRPGTSRAAGESIDAERAYRPHDGITSNHGLTRTSRELAIVLGRLRPLVESVIPPEWAHTHLQAIADHLRAELLAALEAGL